MNRRDRFAHEMLGRPVHVEVDRPVGFCHGGIVYPINYGYIPGMQAGDGEEQDAYVLGVSEPVAAFDGWVVGAVRRKNDREDKLVVAPEGMTFHQGEIAGAVAFQEQYFSGWIVSLLRRSCGVIPYRETEGGREFLLLFQRGSRSWSFPKGHMEAGEAETQTALRELREETGLEARLVPGARTVVEYGLTYPVRKQVVLFLGKVQGELVVQPREIESYRWVEADALADYLPPDTLGAVLELINGNSREIL